MVILRASHKTHSKTCSGNDNSKIVEFKLNVSEEVVGQIYVKMLADEVLYPK